MTWPYRQVILLYSISSKMMKVITGKGLPLAGFLVAFLGSIFFSTKAIIVKKAFVQTHTDALTLLTLRMVFSLPFFAGAAFFAGSQKGGAKLSAMQWAVIIGLGLFGYYLSSLFD